MAPFGLHRLKGSVCLQPSKPYQMQIGVCSQESNGLLIEEMALSPKSQLNKCAKTWLPDGFQQMGYIGKKKSFIKVAKGIGVMVFTDRLRPG